MTSELETTRVANRLTTRCKRGRSEIRHQEGNLTDVLIAPAVAEDAVPSQEHGDPGCSALPHVDVFVAVTVPCCGNKNARVKPRRGHINFTGFHGKPDGWIDLFLYRPAPWTSPLADKSGEGDDSAPRAGGSASPFCTPPSSPRGEKSRVVSQVGSSPSLTSSRRLSARGSVINERAEQSRGGKRGQYTT